MARALCVMAIVRAVMYCSHESQSWAADAARHFKSKNTHFERWGSVFILLIQTKWLLIICFPTNSILRTASALQWHIFTDSKETTQLPNHIQQMWATIHLSKPVKNYPSLHVRWEAEDSLLKWKSSLYLFIRFTARIALESKSITSKSENCNCINPRTSQDYQIFQLRPPEACKAVNLIHHYCWTAEN